MKFLLLILVASMIVCLPVVQAQPTTKPSDSLPTMDELKQMAADKQWQPLLQKLSRVLSLRGQVAASYDRYELLMLKGESHLQLKQLSLAAGAFDDASELKDLSPLNKAIAKASAVLVKRSPSGTYSRKSPTTQPTDPRAIDITDLDKRKSAFAALAADELALLQPRIKSAAGGTSLKPIAEVIRALKDLRAAEMASTNSADTPVADGLLAPLAENARTISTKAVAQMKKQVDLIEASANTVVDTGLERPQRYPGGSTIPGTGTRRYRKRGLTSTDQQNLRDIIATCKNLDQADKQLADGLGQAGAPLLEIAKDTEALTLQADKILNTDYSITTSDPRGFR